MILSAINKGMMKMEMKRRDFEGVIPASVKKQMTAASTFLTVATLTMVTGFATAGGGGGSNYAQTISGILGGFIDFIGTIFIALGIILGAYSVGQLVLAFKNEDSDSKSRAGTMLVVAIVLVAIKPIINSLNLLQYLT